MREGEKRNVSRVLSLHNYPSFFIPNTCSQCLLSCLLFVLGSAGSAQILTPDSNTSKTKEIKEIYFQPFYQSHSYSSFHSLSAALIPILPPISFLYLLSLMATLKAYQQTAYRLAGDVEQFAFCFSAQFFVFIFLG